MNNIKIYYYIINRRELILIISNTARIKRILTLIFRTIEINNL